MNRREFIKTGVITSSALLAAGTLIGVCSCGKSGDRQMPPDLTKIRVSGLSPRAHKILYYASLAPSGHNSQPWRVKIINDTEWIIEYDNQRRLPVVDPENREVMLSLGAFLENLVISARTEGLEAHVSILASTAFDTQVARVRFESVSPVPYPLERIVKRRTLKSHMLPGELTGADIRAFERQAGAMFYFPRKSAHARAMAQQAIENFNRQARNDLAQAEAAKWMRFSDKECEHHLDGLTVKGMEITGPAGWYVRHFMTPEDAMGKAFRKKGMEKTAKQALEGAGWIVITSSGNTVPDWIDAGRRFQKMALVARERQIAIHPMTQTLEEKEGRDHIRKNHQPGMIPQFMLRVGYVNRYPDPVSLRRPVDSFVTAG